MQSLRSGFIATTRLGATRVLTRITSRACVAASLLRPTLAERTRIYGEAYLRLRSGFIATTVAWPHYHHHHHHHNNTHTTMTTHTTEPAVPADTTELTLVDAEILPVIQRAGLAPATAEGLLTSFRPLFARAHRVCAIARDVTITDASQVDEMARARRLRLELKSIRVEAEKLRKSLKEDSLRRGKAIDGVYNVLEYAVAPIEDKMLEVELYAEREAARRRSELAATRLAELRAYDVDGSCFPLGDMTDEQYQQLLDNSRVAHEVRVEAERAAAEAARIERERAEQERIAREAAEAQERERIRAENERLRREAAQREEAARAERERIERERAEQAERERVEIERRTAVHTERMRKLAPYMTPREVDATPHLAYAEMSEAQFAALMEDKQEQARERARVEAERAEAEARAAKERAAREQAERKARELAAAERRKREAEAAERARREAAPDADKLRAIASELRAIQPPAMATVTGRQAVDTIMSRIREVAAYSERIATSFAYPVTDTQTPDTSTP